VTIIDGIEQQEQEVIPQWLRRTATIEELEAEHLLDGIPFGFCNGEWQALKSKVQPGDEIWTFSSPQEDWERMMGWEGIALVREGEIVECFCTGMN
jgi:hypothetical protein